ncbi:MAG: DUF1835 domain-containing protein [Cyclobacteriaceae bacterium]
MTLHVLTGDALLENFPAGKLEGSIAISRECLVEGPVKAIALEEFWSIRESYLSATYPESDINYQDEVAFEFNKLNDLNDGDEVNLWFEHDLFCQVNLWFTLSLLNGKGISVYRVYPAIADPDELWDGFGPMSPEELLKCYEQKILLTPEDIQLGNDLWLAYTSSDNNTLKTLSNTPNEAFPYLKEVCEAQIGRTSESPGRPERILQEIINQGNTSFNKAFMEFSEQEGIYGFGDLQVKKIYDQLMK